MEFVKVTIALLFVAACSTLMTDAGLIRHKRVIGGEQYAKGDYPFLVSLWYMGDNNPYTANTPKMHHTCGGSLVAEQWVLTSAVCFDDFYLFGLSNTSLWRVYLGMYEQTGAEENAQYRTIDQIFTVPEYNLTQIYGDLALLKLDKPATLGSLVGLVEPNGYSSCPQEGQEVDVIGWGQTQTETYGLGSNVPNLATVEVSSLKECQDLYLAPEINAMYGGHLRIDEGSSLCAGLPEGGADACYGDLGSPLLTKCGEDGKDVVVGTVSYANGCAKPGVPAVYTRVSPFYDWIMDTIKDNP